jgi:hypothetical protein
VNKFARFTDLRGDCCYVNVDQIRAITTSKEGRRGGATIVFDSGSSLEVLESLERVLWRCKNAGQADTMPATAY